MSRLRRVAGSAVAVLLLLASVALAVREARRLSADASVEMGLRRFREGRFEDSLRAYDRAVDLDPHSVEARFRRGGALAKLGALAAEHDDSEQARRYLKRAGQDLAAVHDRVPTYANVAYRLAAVQFELGLDADAIALLAEAIRRDPGAPEPWRLRARAFLRAGAARDAVETGIEAARRDPWNPEAHVILARAERALGNADAAVERLRDAETCAPADAGIRLLRAGWLLEDGRVDEALEDAFFAAFRGGAGVLPALRAFQAQRPLDPRAALILARATRKAGDLDGALALYERYAREATPDPRQTEAIARAKAGDAATASALFDDSEAEAVARISPEYLAERAKILALGRGDVPDLRDSETRRRFGATLLRYGRDDLALPILEEGVRQDPDRVLRRLVLAEAYAHAGRLEEAEVHARECVRQGFEGYRAEDDPEVTERSLIEKSVGPRLFEMAFPPESLAENILHSPHDPQARYLAGLYHLFRGDPEKADPCFIEAIKLDPWDLLAVSRVTDPVARENAHRAAVTALRARALRLLSAVLERRGDEPAALATALLADREARGAGIEAAARLEGRAIDVGEPEARAYLVRGFDRDERFERGETGVWWVGPTAELLVELTRPAREVTLRLRGVDLAPLEQEVSVWCGGRLLGRASVGPRFTDHQMPLGRERVGRLRLVLEARYAISPWEWSGGALPDRRPLGAALAEVRFR